MPAATFVARQTNLTRLEESLTAHCVVDPDRAERAQRSARQMPLSHALPIDKLAPVLASGALISGAALGRHPGKAETSLGTTNDVFLFDAAFGRPATECGFLFLPSLEEAYPSEGVATLPRVA